MVGAPPVRSSHREVVQLNRFMSGASTFLGYLVLWQCIFRGQTFAHQTVYLGVFGPVMHIFLFVDPQLPTDGDENALVLRFKIDFQARVSRRGSAAELLWSCLTAAHFRAKPPQLEDVPECHDPVFVDIIRRTPWQLQKRTLRYRDVVPRYFGPVFSC